MATPSAEFLVREFAHMAISIAKAKFFKSQGMLNYSDVESNALGALVSAACRWQSYCEKNDKDSTDLNYFAKHAATRIRGSIDDESRSSTFASRWNISDYQKAREVGIDKPVEEISQKTGITVKRLTAAINAINTDRSMRASYYIEDNEVTSNDVDGSISYAHKAIVERIRSLPKIQKHVLALYYFCELKFSDIADMLGMQKSQVVSIYRETILEVRDIAIEEIC